MNDLRQNEPAGLTRWSGAAISGFRPSGVVRVPFTHGAGGYTLVDVAYISDFPRGADGHCAFCHGDPCAERCTADEPIAKLRKKLGKFFETCPMCDGRPS